MAAKQKVAPTVTLAVELERRPFHETIALALDETVKMTGGSTDVIPLTRLLNRTTVPRDHLLPLAAKLRELAKIARIYPPLIDAANRLEAEHRRLIE